MHNRQSGAAHVNIFFFLVMLILFLAALGFAYFTMEDNKKLRDEVSVTTRKLETATIDELSKDNVNALLYRHYVDDLTKLIGEAGEYKGRDGFNYTDKNEQPVTPIAITNAALPGRVKTVVRDFAQAVKVPEADGLQTFFGLVQNSFGGLERQVSDLDGQRTQLQAQVAQLQGAASTVSSQNSKQVADLNSELSRKTAEHDSAIAEKNNTIQTGNAQYTKVREDMSAQTEEHARTMLEMRKEKNNLTARIDAAADKTKLINPGNAADGMVLDSSQASGVAWINLGRRDMLPMGASFVITAPGKDDVKGFGTVSRVEETRSEVRITGLVNRYNPVVSGDEVRNDLYSPSLRHNIFLMGRFSQPLTKPIVATLLERLGNKVHEKLGPGVDLIILGGDTINEDNSGYTPLSETDVYKEAQNLRIEMATLQKVRDFLKVSE